jgi:nucleoside-diphosphate-sugar epimerase
MGGAGYINTNLYDADVMHNSASINLNVLHQCKEMYIKKVFFSSSACVYNEELQSSNVNPDCRESSAYPAHPDSEYGWEKLFSERLFHAYNRQHGMQNKVARFHNIFGPYGTWDGGKEKFPAAICRKIAKANDGDEIEIWGDGEQTRSFLYIDDCIEGVRHLMNSETFHGPVNIGADQMISINDTVDLVAQIAGKTIRKKHIDGPTGVRGRNSNNELIGAKLNWRPSQNLKDGLKETYRWINLNVRGK